jgi:hypothetical protein
MREPKFSDAPCYGKEFDGGSRVCQVCLANKSCQRKYYQAVASRKWRVAKPRLPTPLRGLSIPSPLATARPAGREIRMPDSEIRLAATA